jgi:ATP-dependent Clp protease protease subunit
MTSETTPHTPKIAFGLFAGLIDQQAVQRLANVLSISANNGMEHVHLLFQTTGGSIGDGICLYNMLRTAPVKFTLYNAGQIASIGVVAFLGAQGRKTSPHAAFMIHKTSFSPIAATSDRLQSAANAAMLDDKRVEAILHERVKLPTEKWDVHKVADLWLSADEAVTAGIADGIADFSPTKGEQMFYAGPV